MQKFTSVLITTVLLLLGTQLFAQNYNMIGQDVYYAIPTAVPFLTIAPDARAGGMGDIGCATSAYVNSQSYNPAKYVFSDNRFGFSVSYSPWLRQLDGDINLVNLSGYWKITDKDALGASFRYFSLGNFSLIYGQTTYTLHPNEFAIDLSYSRKLIDELSIAITPRFIYSNGMPAQIMDNEEKKANLAGAADISLFYEQNFAVKGLNNSTLRAGLCLSNLSFMKMAYSSRSLYTDFLPANMKLGLGYEMNFDGKNKLAITGEVNKLLVPTPPIYLRDSVTGGINWNIAEDPIIVSGMDPDVSAPMGMIQSSYDAPGGFKEEMQEFMWALGAEYSYRDLLFARVGYFHESQFKGDRQFFSVGVGAKYSIVGLDMSYLIATKKYQPLANTMRFTVTVDFVSAKKEDIVRQGRWKTK